MIYTQIIRLALRLKSELADDVRRSFPAAKSPLFAAGKWLAEGELSLIASLWDAIKPAPQTYV